MTIATYIIIAVTVIVSLICFGNGTLFYRLSLNPYSVTKQRQWYRLLTYGFVHGDLGHLFINMLVFFSFGVAIEQFLSTGVFVGFYLGALVFSAIPDLLKHRGDHTYNSIGASGAVSATIFAMIFLNPWGKILFYFIIPLPMILFGVLYVIYEQWMSKRGRDNINHSAHLYGALYGILFLIVYEPATFTHFFSSLLKFSL